MNATILCVGKLKEKWQADGCNEYLKRLSRYGKYEVIAVDDVREPDKPSDALIRQALKEKLEEATVILIAHRVTTLMQADCIMVLDKGKIAEIGSHEELMEKNGIYRKIYDMQMTVEEEEVEADE